MGLAAKSVLVKVTLSAVPGAPAGDQFPPEDQRVSAAVPFQAFSSPEAGMAVASRAASSMTAIAWRCRFFMSLTGKWEPAKTALRSWVANDSWVLGVAGFMT